MAKAQVGNAMKAMKAMKASKQIKTQVFKSPTCCPEHYTPNPLFNGKSPVTAEEKKRGLAMLKDAIAMLQKKMRKLRARKLKI